MLAQVSSSSDEKNVENSETNSVTDSESGVGPQSLFNASTNAAQLVQIRQRDYLKQNAYALVQI